jgi:hypothetical protein
VAELQQQLGSDTEVFRGQTAKTEASSVSLGVPSKAVGDNCEHQTEGY